MYTSLKYLILFVSISLALFIAVQRIPNTNFANPPTQKLSSIQDKVTTSRYKIEHRIKKAKFNRRFQIFCRALVPERKIRSMVHHKTGHDLSWQIRDVIQAFCHGDTRYETEFSINKLVNYCLSKYRQYSTGCTLIHWVRHPVNTIISGYYYHLKTDEVWVHDWIISDSVNTAVDMDMNALYNDIIHNTTNSDSFYDKYREEKVFQHLRGDDEEKMMQKKKQMTKLLTCFDIGEKSVLYTYLAPFVHNMRADLVIDSEVNMDITLQEFYRKLQKMDYKYGLFWEFVRYFNCEWPSIYVLRKIGNEHFDHLIEYDIDDMMDREGAFGEAMDLILDEMNFVDNVGNRQKLLRNHLNISIVNARKRLKEALVSLNVNNYSTKGDHYLKMHVTHKSYDMDQVSHDLLTIDRTICQLIRNMTELLNFEWTYSQYC